MNKQKKNIEYNLLSYILEKNKKEEYFTQREIAKALNISLGMLNSILKKTVNTGFLKISKMNNKKYSYLLTKDGMNLVYKRSMGYFKRITKNSFMYKNSIMELLNNKKDEGYENILLLGDSTIDFIVDYCCSKLNLNYEKIEKELVEDFNYKDNSFLLVSENLEKEQISIVINKIIDSQKNINSMDLFHAVEDIDLEIS